MKEIRPKEDKAVSPIIATILLIAITVVLAATLVTILGGFTHSAKNTFGDASATVTETNVSASPSSLAYDLNLSISSFSGSSVSNSHVTATVTFSDGGTISFVLSSSSSISSLGNITSIKSSSSSFTSGTVYLLKANRQVASIDLSYSGATIYSSGTISLA